MKTLLFLLIPFFAFGQECYDSTSYDAVQGGLFKKTVFKICEDGSGTSQTFKAETGQFWANDAQNKATVKAHSWRTMLTETSKIPNGFKEVKRELNAIKAATGVSGMDTIQKREIVPFLLPGFKIKESSGVSDIVFSVNANGQMKFKIGSASLKNAFILPGLIELQDYPTTGQNTIFSQLENGNYVSPGRLSVIRQPGSTANLPQSSKKKQ